MWYSVGYGLGNSVEANNRAEAIEKTKEEMRLCNEDPTWAQDIVKDMIERAKPEVTECKTKEELEKYYKTLEVK